MRFRYIGTAAVRVSTLGHDFEYGVPTLVTPDVANKLRNNPYFREVADVEGVDIVPRRRGRPPKSVSPELIEDQPDADDDQDDE